MVLIASKSVETLEFKGFQTYAIIPTRCRDSWINEFCLGIICSCSSENFDSPYYRSCTMEAYQNLISGDKSLLGYMVIALVGLIVLFQMISGF